jgi:DNA-binding NtrC family response regulator
MNMSTSRLNGARILVLEDDYYLATDLETALEDAGAHVIGPFADAVAAAEALAADPPDCALIDLNLGEGICLDVPRELVRRSIPFAFVTGYDRTAIPEEFANTVRVEKPVAAQQAARMIERLLPAYRT